MRYPHALLREDGVKVLQVNQNEQFIHHKHDFFLYKNDVDDSVRIQSASCLTRHSGH